MNSISEYPNCEPPKMTYKDAVFLLDSFSGRANFSLALGEEVRRLRNRSANTNDKLLASALEIEAMEVSHLRARIKSDPQIGTRKPYNF